MLYKAFAQILHRNRYGVILVTVKALALNKSTLLMMPKFTSTASASRIVAGRAPSRADSSSWSKHGHHRREQAGKDITEVWGKGLKNNHMPTTFTNEQLYQNLYFHYFNWPYVPIMIALLLSWEKRSILSIDHLTILNKLRALWLL